VEPAGPASIIAFDLPAQRLLLREDLDEELLVEDELDVLVVLQF
jgi:hypothetical protein